MESKFTEQESLAVISEMIDRAKNNIQRGSADSMIFWGYLVAFTATMNFILMHVLDKPLQAYWVWCLMIPGFVVSFFIHRKVDRTAIVKTHIDRIISSIWKAFSISVILFFTILYALAFTWNNYQMYLLITPVIMLMIGLAQYGTGIASRYNPFLYGAYVMWGGAVCCLLSYVLLGRGDVQFLIMAIGMILSFVVPGHLMNKKVKNHV